VRLAWERASRHTPIPPELLARLEPGRSDLAQCLAELGAPLWVFEHVEDGRSGAALAFGWYDQRDLGLRVSVPVYRGLAASFEYDRIDQRMRGAVLFFDPDWRLVTCRAGLLRDLTREFARPRPQLVEEDA
jgi:hypothetical protein